MKRVFLIVGFSVLALAQNPVPHGKFQVSALEMRQTGSVYYLSGKVVIESDAMRLRADSAEYDENTNEISAHGDVRVTVK